MPGRLHGCSRSRVVHGRTYGGGRHTVSDERRAGSAAGPAAGLKPDPGPRVSFSQLSLYTKEKHREFYLLNIDADLEAH